MKHLTVQLFFILTFYSCNSEKVKPDGQSNSEDIEAREDSLELIAAYEAQRKITNVCFALKETSPVNAGNMEDAADDPAIWFNASNPEKSLVFGSNKKEGIAVYDLHGKQTAYLPIGKINNIDIVKNAVIQKDTLDLLGGTNRSSQAVSLYRVNSDGSLVQLIPGGFRIDTSKIDDVYGFCFFKDKEAEPSVLINGKNGYFQHFRIEQEQEKYSLVLVGEKQFDSQTEGMVADEASQRLYVGEENRGVWFLDFIDENFSDPQFIDATSPDNNPFIVADVEGLALYRDDAEALLLASSQGNFSYGLFDINDSYRYIGSFKVLEKVVDGVEETDGIDIFSGEGIPGYPKGLFVAQDGFNFDGDSLKSQNFKYLTMADILRAVGK